MGMNWNQTGMPSAFISRLGQKRELGEFKSVLNDARNHVLRPVDAEAMAQTLFDSGGREFVDMVKELTTALDSTKRELEDANRRYERLVADLERCGISITDDTPPESDGAHEEPSGDRPPSEPKPQTDGAAEWEEWDRRFRALLG